MADDIWTCGHCGENFATTDFRVTSLIYDKKWVCEECALQEDSIWLDNISKAKLSSARTA